MAQKSNSGMHKLHTIIYKSSAKNALTTDELKELAKISYFNNYLCEISGLLIYYEQHFLQVLEGRKELVEMIFESIKNDDRHHHITLIKNEPLASRAFEQWSMGLVVIDHGSELERNLQDEQPIAINQFNTLEAAKANLLLELFAKTKLQKYIQ